MSNEIGIVESDGRDLAESMRRAVPLAQAMKRAAVDAKASQNDAFAASLMVACEFAAKAGVAPEDFDRYARQQYGIIHAALRGNGALDAFFQTLPRKDPAAR